MWSGTNNTYENVVGRGFIFQPATLNHQRLVWSAPRPRRRYKDKLCLRHRHSPPLYAIILWRSSSTRLSRSLSRSQHTISYYILLLNSCPVSSCSVSLTLASWFLLVDGHDGETLRRLLRADLSLPLRLVPTGNKDGSVRLCTAHNAWCSNAVCACAIRDAAAPGGGVKLPSVGRTNANDSSVQDGAKRRSLLPARCFIFSMRSTMLYTTRYIQV